MLLTMSNVSNIHVFNDYSKSTNETNMIPADIVEILPENDDIPYIDGNRDINKATPVLIKNKDTQTSPVINKADFGIWICTKYNSVSNTTKLDIDLAQFTLMLSSLAWKYYYIDLEQKGDSRVGIQFSRTQVYVEGQPDPYVNVFQTQVEFTTTCETDKELEVSLEIRYPFSLINKVSISQNIQLDSSKSIISQKFSKILLTLGEKTHNKLLNIISEKLISIHKQTNENNDNTQPMITNSESYFCLRTGFSSPEGEQLPRKILTRFFSGRDKLLDPQILRMSIAPELNGVSALTYFNSYSNVYESGSEAFYRSFSIDFQPAVELQITSILREAKIRYDFGRSAGVSIKISLQALGGILSSIVQHFTIDPLPEHMSFDLTVFGERSFRYEADQRYSVTYTADSIQNENLIKLDLKDLPLIMNVDWGLDVSLIATSASGLIDVNMSNDIGEVSLSLFGSATPFIRVTNFPKAIRLEALVDVLNLNGYVRASKVSDTTTVISVPVRFDKWLITGNLNMYNGYGQVSFNLPGNDDPYASVGLDTNGNALFGLGITVVDTQTNTQVLLASVGNIATDNFLVSFNSSGGEISSLRFYGMITELTNIQVKIDYQGLNFDISGTWVLRQEGSFSIEVSKTINLTLDNIDAGDFILSGSILANPGGYVKVEWQRGFIGYFIFSTHGINAEVDVTFGAKYSSNVYFYGKVTLAPGATVKFTWDWSPNGNFMVFCNLFEEINVEAYINYSPDQQQYQYGFKAQATDVMFTRTLKWDVANLRFWWLGDEPLPGQWDVKILWDYKWHDVL